VADKLKEGEGGNPLADGPLKKELNFFAASLTFFARPVTRFKIIIYKIIDYNLNAL